MDGIINVLKPAGMTSFDVIAFLRRIYGQKKIGHGGTLDPMAAGVLPVFLGRAARLIEYAPIHQKTYEAEFMMGISTDTEDLTGEVVRTGIIEEDICRWKLAAEKFCGNIEQVPSIYSAILINGRRAYQMARNGENVDLPKRRVRIYNLDIREIEAPYIRMSITCSSGTYVRALGRDLGNEVGVPLAMSFLLRTRMGPFEINEARTLEEIEKNPSDCLISDLRPILSHLKSVELQPAKAADFLQGKRLHTVEIDAETVAVFSEGRFLGVASAEKGILHPRKVFS